MVSAFREERTSTYRIADDVRCELHWKAEYDDAAKTVTFTADDTPVGCTTECVVTVVLANGQVRTFDLLALGPPGGPSGTSVMNLGPLTYTGVNLKMGSSRNIGTIDASTRWSVEP